MIDVQPGTKLDPDILEKALLDDALKVMGLARIPVLRSIVSRVLGVPVGRLARTAAAFDSNIATLGLQEASGILLRDYVKTIAVSRSDVIPREGPLMILSNHPAAYDVFIIATLLPRDDLKIIASEIAVLHRLPSFAEHFIFIGNNDSSRMAAARSALHHLREGGALLVFASGTVDPDPDVSPHLGLSIDPWYSSPALFIRRAPETRIILSIVSGILSRRWFRSPVTLLRPRIQDKQKVAEIFQVVQQLLLPGRFRFSPRVSFSEPIAASTLREQNGAVDPVKVLYRLAEGELVRHLSAQWQPDESVRP